MNTKSKIVWMVAAVAVMLLLAGRLTPGTVNASSIPNLGRDRTEWGVRGCDGSVCLPAKPKLISPADGSVVSTRRATLEWSTPDGATSYTVVVRVGTNKGEPLQLKEGVTKNTLKTKKLEDGQTYFWRVSACNESGCKASRWRSFSKSQ